MILSKKLSAFLAAAILAASVCPISSYALEPDSSDTASAVTEKEEDEKPVPPEAIKDYTVFEAVKMRRDLLNETGSYTADDYDVLSKYLVNNTVYNIRYFTLSYNTDGADLCNYEDPTDLDPKEVIYKSKVKIVVANLEKEGYVQTGWQYGGNIYTSDYFKMPANDVVMEPVWIKRCKITYTAGNYDDIIGNSSASVMSAENVQFYLADSGRFSRPGYVISGWKSSYDDTVYKPGESLKLPPEDITFEALWSPMQYTVSLSANNGVFNDRLTLKARYTEDFVLPECEFTNGDLKFAGWKYNGQIYQPGESFPVPALPSGQKIVVVATWE